jgi:hypothetical protein
VTAIGESARVVGWRRRLRRFVASLIGSLIYFRIRSSDRERKGRGE